MIHHPSSVVDLLIDSVKHKFDYNVPWNTECGFIKDTYFAPNMALHERLNKFRQQQERCQTTLSSIAANQASTPRSNITRWVQPTNGPSTPAKPPQRKFSDDTERLQRINSVRKSPAAAQIKIVIELLEKTRQALTADQINEATYVHIHGNKEVFDRLKNNPKVHFDGNLFSYKSKYGVNGKDKLLSLIRKFPDGLAVAEIKDAYLAVLEDLKALKASGDVCLVASTTKSDEGVVYPEIDPMSKIKFDDDLKELARSILLPRDMLDIKELQKNGQPTRTNAAKRRADAQILLYPPKPNKSKKKPRGLTGRTKLTNAHLPELFMDLKT
uniref:TFIIE beta domain-containing protein n=3 Tax=Oryza TaxID=4527 RepID=A0A0D3FEI4_9ORYZ